MKNINTSLKSIIIFYLFLIVLLIIGFQCKYNKPDFCQIPFFSNFWNENGFLENLQSIFLLISIIFLFIAKKKFKKVKIINIFLILKIMALIYFLGEEISLLIILAVLVIISAIYILHFDKREDTSIYWF